MTETEQFCADYEDAILMTFLTSLIIWTVALVAAIPQKQKGHYTLPYHARMAGLWICIASTIIGGVAGLLCMLREMDKTVARESRERYARDLELRQLQDALKRASIAEADLAKCEAACCKPFGNRLPAKGTQIHHGTRPKVLPTANNDRRLYR